MSKQEPFAVVEGEGLKSALEDFKLHDDLKAALGDFEDSVEIISAHRRDTLRG